MSEKHRLEGGKIRKLEIEKKYLLKYFPEDMQKGQKKELEQGYLCTTPVVRIRKSNEDYILTYKSKRDVVSKDNLCINQEIEMPLTREGYEHLREKADGRLITKTRYLVPLDGGKTAEVDVFHEFFHGLVFAEVEFASVEEADRFTPPDWFGEDVSGDFRYSNSYLSTCETPFWEGKNVSE